MLNPFDLTTQAHLWYCPVAEVDVSGARAAFEAQLSEEEMARYQRFRFDKDKDLFLVSHVFLRQILTYYTGIPREKLMFTVNAYGRPELVKYGRLKQLRFNLSHTDGMAALIVSDAAECGVDVERFGRMNDLEAIAQRFFSAAETQELFALPQEEREQQFYAYWTLKESYIKAKGKGLSIPLSRFSFSLKGDIIRNFACEPALNEQSSQWQFGLIKPLASHQLAWAFKNLEEGQWLEVKRQCYVPVAR
jgi:4'-phosphopantetheinyl transferase